MLLFVLAEYSKVATMGGFRNTIYYEIPKLTSYTNLQFMPQSSRQYYFVALSSDPVVVNANIEVFCDFYYGPSMEGGVVFQVPKLTLRTVNIKFTQEKQNILLTVVRNNNELFVFDSQLVSLRNSFSFYMTGLTSLSDAMGKNCSVLLENQFSTKTEIMEACASCNDAQSSLADHCWGCPADQLIESLEQKKCKCIYSNAQINADNICVTSKIYNTVETMDDSGTVRAYALACTSGIQIDLGLNIAFASYASFGTLKDDLCVPKNMYVRGFISIMGMSESTFEYGGLAHRAEGGATNIHFSLKITNNARSFAGSLIYARTKENATAPIVISRIFIMGYMKESYGTTYRYSYPKGCLIAIVVNADVQLSGIYTFGIAMQNYYIQDIGILMGQIRSSNTSFSSIYIAPYQQTKQEYAIDPALGDWSKVDLPCSAQASELLKPSMKLQALYKQYNSQGETSQFLDINVYNFGGLSGLVLESNVTVNNVISVFNFREAVYTYGAAHLFALVQQSNTLVDNCYIEGNSSAFRNGGPIAMIQGGIANLTIAAKFEIRGEYDGGVVSRVNYTATVNLRAAIKATYGSSLWNNGIFGYVQGSSDVNVLEAIGWISYVSSKPSYSGNVIGRMEYSRLDGVSYQNTSGINTATNSKVNYC